MDAKRVEMFDRYGNYMATFRSVGRAAEITGIDIDYIKACCERKQKPSGLYSWQYKEAVK